MNKNIIFAALVYLFSTKITFAVGDTANVLSGLLHPILGFDHLIAMVTVGLLSVKLHPSHLDHQLQIEPITQPTACPSI